jgi:hypothetical protein
MVKDVPETPLTVKTVFEYAGKTIAQPFATTALTVEVTLPLFCVKFNVPESATENAA